MGSCIRELLKSWNARARMVTQFGVERIASASEGLMFVVVPRGGLSQACAICDQLMITQDVASSRASLTFIRHRARRIGRRAAVSGVYASRVWSREFSSPPLPGSCCKRSGWENALMSDDLSPVELIWARVWSYSGARVAADASVVSLPSCYEALRIEPGAHRGRSIRGSVLVGR